MKSAAILHAKLVGHLRLVNVTRNSAEKLLATQKLTRRDVELIYRGIFIDTCTSFERFLEDLFLGYLCKKYKPSTGNVITRIDVRSLPVAREVLKGSRSYVDWLPINLTIDRANLFFRKGFPFSTISTQDKKDLLLLTATRNALAHNSKFSSKKFVDAAKANFPFLTLSEQKPIDFLRSLYSRSPSMTHFEFMLRKISHISRSIS